MNQINRLLIQARKAAIPSIYRALCIIRYDDITGKWIAAPQLWDKHFGRQTLLPDWISEYNTAEEATEAVEQLYESLNVSDPERLVILIDDVGV